MIPMPAFLAGLSTTAQVSLSAFAFFVFYVFYWLQRVPKGFPPGPFRLPVLGNLPEFGVDPTKTILPAKYRKYGGIFSMQLGTVPAVILTEPSIFLAAMKRGGLKTAGRPVFSEYLNAICLNGHDMFMTQPDERWSNVRKFLHSNVFKPSALTELGIADKLNRQLNRLYSKFDEANGKSVAPLDLVRFSFFSLILDILYGREFLSAEDPEFKDQNETWKIIFDSCALGRPGDFMPKWLVNFLERNRKKEEEPFYKALVKVREWTTVQIEQHEAAIEKAKKTAGSLENYKAKDLCDQFILHRENAPESFVSGPYHEAWLDSVSINLFLRNLFSGGSDTTAAFITFAIMLAANYPEKQKKVQAELDSVMGDREWPMMEDEANCPYTRAFIKEVHRYKPLSPTLAHAASKAVDLTDLNGKTYNIPQDVCIFAILPTMFRDDQVWGDGNNFRPERFLDMTQQKEAEILHPFGVGPRTCPGQNLAVMTSWLSIASLFKRYEIRSATGRPIDEDHQLGLTLTPKPFEVLFNKRK